MPLGCRVWSRAGNRCSWLIMIAVAEERLISPWAISCHWWQTLCTITLADPNCAACTVTCPVAFSFILCMSRSRVHLSHHHTACLQCLKGLCESPFSRWTGPAVARRSRCASHIFTLIFALLYIKVCFLPRIFFSR